MFPRPLEPYPIFRSPDLDETRELTSCVLCEHYLDVLDQTASLDARLNSTRVRDVVLNYMEYGAPVLVDPGETESFLVVQGHLKGRGVVRSGRDQIAANRARTVVSSPREPLRMMLSADTELILARIGLAAVRRVLADLLGEEDGQVIRFELGMAVANGMPRRWYSSLLSQIARVTRGDELLNSPWWAELFEESLISRLLHLQPSTDLDGGFRNYLGISLADFLVAERLRAAYDQLSTVEPGQVRLLYVARHWGFADPIQFASSYTEAFGETSEQTLRR